MTATINEGQATRFKGDFDELKRSYGDLLLVFMMNDADLPQKDRRRLNRALVKLDEGIRGLKEELTRLTECEVI